MKYFQLRQKKLICVSLRKQLHAPSDYKFCWNINTRNRLSAFCFLWLYLKSLTTRLGRQGIAMGTCKIKANNQSHLGIFMHTLICSGILMHNEAYSGIIQASTRPRVTFAYLKHCYIPAKYLLWHVLWKQLMALIIFAISAFQDLYFMK